MGWGCLQVDLRSSGIPTRHDGTCVGPPNEEWMTSSLLFSHSSDYFKAEESAAGVPRQNIETFVTANLSNLISPRETILKLQNSQHVQTT